MKSAIAGDRCCTPNDIGAAIEAPLHEYEDSDVIYNAHGGVLHHPGMPKTNAEQLEMEQRS